METPWSSLGSRSLPQRGHLFAHACCPTLDLVAVASGSSVEVFRTGGTVLAKVWSFGRADATAWIEALEWRPDGSFPFSRTY